MIENLISISALLDVPSPAAKTFNARYTAKYKKMTAWETVWNYNGIMVVSRAIAAAGILDDPIAIRAAFPKSFPKLADTFPYEVHGISDAGLFNMPATVQMVRKGKFTPVALYDYWSKTPQEFNKVRQQTKYTIPMLWFKYAK